MRTIYLFTDDDKGNEYPVQDHPTIGELIRINMDGKDCGVYVAARVTVLESLGARKSLCDFYPISGGCDKCTACYINTYGIECLPDGRVDEHAIRSVALCKIGSVLKSVDNIMESL